MENLNLISEEQWDELVLKISKHFKVTADFDFMLFIIGIQERGTGFRPYPRNEKNDLINLGKCNLFELLGYIKRSGNDDEGWPKFDVIKNVSTITPGMQKQLLKKAMHQYFSQVLN